MSDDLVNQSYSDPFIRKVVTFIASDSFQTKFENFFLYHSPKFSDAEEHEFFYYELYQQFQDMFDKELMKFCNENSITKENFYKLCQDAIEVDEKANHYIQILLSSVEYETFVRLMRIMKPIAEIKLKNQNNKTDDERKKGSKESKGHDEVELDEYSSTYPSESKTSGSHSDSKSSRKGLDNEDNEMKDAVVDFDDDAKDAKK